MHFRISQLRDFHSHQTNHEVSRRRRHPSARRSRGGMELRNPIRSLTNLRRQLAQSWKRIKEQSGLSRFSTACALWYK